MCCCWWFYFESSKIGTVQLSVTRMITGFIYTALYRSHYALGARQQDSFCDCTSGTTIALSRIDIFVSKLQDVQRGILKIILYQSFEVATVLLLGNGVLHHYRHKRLSLTWKIFQENAISWKRNSYSLQSTCGHPIFLLEIGLCIRNITS